MHDMQTSYTVKYIDYSYAAYAVKTKPRGLSFPWRITPERQAQYVYSMPLAAVSTKLYYNKRYFPDGNEPQLESGLKVGCVAATVYGSEVQSAIDIATRAGGIVQKPCFRSEAAALKALLTGAVQLVPLPQAVMHATMNSIYPNQTPLISALADIEDAFTLHMIASRNEEGQKFMNAFNASFSKLQDEGVIKAWRFADQIFTPQFAQAATLVASEGFPVIIGREENDGKDLFYALPLGSRVLVLEWSPYVAESLTSDSRVYPAMTGETKVLMLNEPHVGKTLHVKTMHLSLTQ